MTETTQHWFNDSAPTGEPCGPRKTATASPPPEPAHLAAVRDRHGYVHTRHGDEWFCPADGKARAWPDVQTYGPLWLLVDGPVLT